MIGNGIYGKKAQKTPCYNSDLVHESLYNGGVVTPTAHHEIVESKISNPLHANFITAAIRAAIAVVAKENHADMVVTDSVMVETGKFIPSQDINTGYKHLDEILHTLDWDERAKCDIAIVFKERDYILLNTDESLRSRLESELWDGELSDEVLNALEIVKVAKRGWKPPAGVTGRDADIQYLKDSLPLLNAGERKFEKPQLLGGKPYLQGKGVLNSEIKQDVKMGGYNKRHDCPDEYEYRRRKMRDALAKRKGFADELELKYKAPEGHKRAVARCKPKDNVSWRVPLDIKRILVFLNLSRFRRMKCVYKALSLGNVFPEFELSVTDFEKRYGLRDLEVKAGIYRQIIQSFVKDLEKAVGLV